MQKKQFLKEICFQAADKYMSLAEKTGSAKYICQGEGFYVSVYRDGENNYSLACVRDRTGRIKKIFARNLTYWRARERVRTLLFLKAVR